MKNETHLNRFIPETPKCSKQLKTLMECHRMRNFIRVKAVCPDKNDIQRKKYIHYLLRTIFRERKCVITNLLYQTRRNNPLLHKGLNVVKVCFQTPELNRPKFTIITVNIYFIQARINPLQSPASV